MGSPGERSEEVTWKFRMMKDTFEFSRGIFVTGTTSEPHALMLELTSCREDRRHRTLHLIHCTEVPAAFKDVAALVRFYQGPVPPRPTMDRAWGGHQPPAPVDQQGLVPEDQWG